MRALRYILLTIVFYCSAVGHEREREKRVFRKKVMATHRMCEYMRVHTQHWQRGEVGESWDRLRAGENKWKKDTHHWWHVHNQARGDGRGRWGRRDDGPTWPIGGVGPKSKAENCSWLAEQEHGQRERGEKGRAMGLVGAGECAASRSWKPEPEPEIVSKVRCK